MDFYFGMLLSVKTSTPLVSLISFSWNFLIRRCAYCLIFLLEKFDHGLKHYICCNGVGISIRDSLILNCFFVLSSGTCIFNLLVSSSFIHLYFLFLIFTMYLLEYWNILGHYLSLCIFICISLISFSYFLDDFLE